MMTTILTILILSLFITLSAKRTGLLNTSGEDGMYPQTAERNTSLNFDSLKHSVFYLSLNDTNSPLKQLKLLFLNPK